MCGNYASGIATGVARIPVRRLRTTTAKKRISDDFQALKGVEKD
jgi:hypothetical protein